MFSKGTTQAHRVLTTAHTQTYTTAPDRACETPIFAGRATHACRVAGRAVSLTLHHFHSMPSSHHHRISHSRRHNRATCFTVAQAQFSQHNALSVRSQTQHPPPTLLWLAPPPGPPAAWWLPQPPHCCAACQSPHPAAHASTCAGSSIGTSTHAPHTQHTATNLQCMSPGTQLS